LQHTFDNGLTLLGERMPGVQSAAMTLLVPAGSATDPPEETGSAAVLSDLVMRGAGERDNRALTEYFDTLGLQRSSSVGVHHMRFGSAALAAKVMESLPAFADVVRRPQMPEAGFDAAQDLAIQALEGLEDEPRQKVLIKLREVHFPHPYGRSTMGKQHELEAVTLAGCKADHARRFQPRGAILSLAGAIDFAEIKAAVGEHFGDWRGVAPEVTAVNEPPAAVHHENHESEQTHIGIAWPSVPETHADYYIVRLAMEALGGGMSGRLFTEVREKRGLVYNVWAGYTSLKGYGSILGYAGTSNDRAQATLETFLAEVHRLADGLDGPELDRAKIGLKAATIMQGESTSARAGSIAHDYFIRGRIRTLDEIKAAIDGVTLEAVNAWLKRNRPGPFTIVTVGPRELVVPG